MGRTQVLFRKNEGSEAQALIDEIRLLLPHIAGKAASGPLQVGTPKVARQQASSGIKRVTTQVEVETQHDVNTGQSAPAVEETGIAVEDVEPDESGYLVTTNASKTRKSAAPKERKIPKAIDVSVEAVAARKKALDARPFSRLLATTRADESWSGSLVGVTFANGSVRYRNQVQSLLGARARVEIAGQKSQHSDIGGIVVGGLLFGPIGAIVGAGGDVKNDFRELYLYITGTEYEWVVKCKPNQTKAIREFASALNSAALHAGHVGL